MVRSTILWNVHVAFTNICQYSMFSTYPKKHKKKNTKHFSCGFFRTIFSYKNTILIFNQNIRGSFFFSCWKTRWNSKSNKKSKSQTKNLFPILFYSIQNNFYYLRALKIIMKYKPTKRISILCGYKKLYFSCNKICSKIKRFIHFIV